VDGWGQEIELYRAQPNITAQDLQNGKDAGWKHADEPQDIEIKGLEHRKVDGLNHKFTEIDGTYVAKKYLTVCSACDGTGRDTRAKLDGTGQTRSSTDDLDGGDARKFFRLHLKLLTKDIEFENGQKAFVEETVERIMTSPFWDKSDPAEFWKKSQKWVADEIDNRETCHSCGGAGNKDQPLLVHHDRFYHGVGDGTRGSDHESEEFKRAVYFVKMLAEPTDETTTYREHYLVAEKRPYNAVTKSFEDPVWYLCYVDSWGQVTELYTAQDLRSEWKQAASDKTFYKGRGAKRRLANREERYYRTPVNPPECSLYSRHPHCPGCTQCA